MVEPLRHTMAVVMAYLSSDIDRDKLKMLLEPEEGFSEDVDNNTVILTQKRKEIYKGMNSLIVIVNIIDGSGEPKIGTFKVLDGKIHISGLRTLEQIEYYTKYFLDALYKRDVVDINRSVSLVQCIMANANYTIQNPPDSYIIAKHIKNVLRDRPEVTLSPDGDPLVYWLPVDNIKSSPTRTFYVILNCISASIVDTDPDALDPELFDETEPDITNSVLRKHNEVSYMFRINKKKGEGSITQSCPSWDYSELSREIFVEAVEKIKQIELGM